MIEDGAENNPDSTGGKNYASYKTRAHYPDAVFDAVEVLLGIMHRRPAQIELPQAMEGMLESATVKGESLQTLLRRINEQQLKTGRLGLMLDLPVSPREENGDVPYIAMYEELDIINWDDGSRSDPTLQKLNLVVLEETEEVRQDDFEWREEEKYRVLQLGSLDENEPTGTYSVELHSKTTDQPTLKFVPQIKGRTLDEIPFVFCNAKDLVPEPDRPPLNGLANLSLAIYRAEADHRQALFMQGQDTLVVVGGDDKETYRVGVGATIVTPLTGDAKYIGTNPVGLPEMRKNIENDKKIASHKAAQMTDTTSRQKESGDALRTRVGAQTATINQIVLAGAMALQDILRIAAKWVGADPMQVIVLPNMEFADDELTGKTIVEYMSAKMMGAPFSLQSIHELLAKKGMTKLTFEQEQALIEAEPPPPAPPGTDAGGDEPPDDDGDEGDGEDE
jgi:hypothetical protein